MKKFMVYFCAAAMMLMCVGCGQTEEESSTASAAPSKEISLTKEESSEESAEESSEEESSEEESSEEESSVEESSEEEKEEVSESAKDTAKDSGNAQADFTYADLIDCNFTLSSGVGAWSTDFTVNPDGSFSGAFMDMEMGVVGDDYNGVEYLSSFTGHFGELTKIDDLTYSTTITDLQYVSEVDTEEIVEGVKYSYTTAYGLTDSETVYFYLAGSKVADLPEQYRSWVSYTLADYSTGTVAEELPYVGFYNESTGYGFFSATE